MKQCFAMMTTRIVARTYKSSRDLKRTDMKIILTIVAAIYIIFSIAMFAWAMKYDSVEIDDEGNIIDE